MIKCSECGKEFDENLKECPDCGAKVIEERTFTCGICGAEVPESAKSCPKCGATFELEENDDSLFIPLTPQERYQRTVNRLGIIKIVFIVATIIFAIILLILAIDTSNITYFIAASVYIVLALITCVFIDWCANVLECLSTLTQKKK